MTLLSPDDRAVNGCDARPNQQEPLIPAPDTPAEKPVLGIPCPGCGAILGSVLFTRQAPNQILRVRKCEACRRRVRTAERIVAANAPGRDEAAPLPASK